MHWYLEVLRKTGDFEGRARRMEYWMFVLINTGIALLFFVLDSALGLAQTDKDGKVVFSPIYFLYCLLSFVPSLAVTVRRLHDINYSGWHVLIAIIPCAGAVLMLVWTIREGDAGRNDYGADPLGRGKKRKKKKPRPVEEDEEDAAPPPKRKRAAEPQWEVVEDEEERPPSKRKRAVEPQWEVVEDEEERPRPRNVKRPRPRDED